MDLGTKCERNMNAQEIMWSNSEAPRDTEPDDQHKPVFPLVTNLFRENVRRRG